MKLGINKMTLNATPFLAYFGYFEQIIGILWDHLVVCVYVLL
jgi:hypothetical protein